jgi:hypothetical protein
MGRVSRRRSTRLRSKRLRVRAIVVGAIIVVLAWAVGAWGVAAWAVSVASAEAPTVTFHGGPLAPALCPAAPDRPNLDIVEGTWVNVVNRTGAKATLEVDGSLSQTIAKDDGLSVMLPPGRHDLRLIPQCAVHGTMLPVVIEVSLVQPGRSPAPSAGPPASPPAGSPPSVGPVGSGGDTDAGTGGGAGPAGGAGGENGGGVNGAGRPVASGGPPGPAGAPTSDSGLHGSVTSGVASGAGIVVVPYDVAETGDRRGARLLAVIATICVLGVTVAIIRAILAQRTTRTTRVVRL